MVITQREAISLQDALVGKLNKHWQWSFRRAAWPKQTAVERTEKGGGMKWRLSYSWERERARSTAFSTLIKSRDTAVEKVWRKEKFTWAKVGVGEDWQRQTNRQLLTNSCIEHFTDREGEGEREGRRERKRKREHPCYKNGKSTF